MSTQQGKECKIIDFSNRNLQNAPSRLNQGTLVVELFNNSLTDLETIDFINSENAWSNVRELYLDHNLLRRVPQSLCTGMFSLTHLTLHNNKLDSLPENIGDLQNLREIRIDHNQITRLPDSICTLQHLRLLHIDGNPITSLPEEIGKLSELLDLGIGSCSIDRLPQSFTKLSKLILFWFEQRSFDNVPHEIISGGRDTLRDIMEYLQFLFHHSIPAFNLYFAF